MKVKTKKKLKLWFQGPKTSPWAKTVCATPLVSSAFSPSFSH